MSYTLKMFNTGQVTLPKKFRSKYNTNHYIAIEQDDGLLIKPLVTDQTVFYENGEWFGLYNSSGLDAAQIISEIDQLHNG